MPTSRTWILLLLLLPVLRAPAQTNAVAERLSDAELGESQDGELLSLIALFDSLVGKERLRAELHARLQAAGDEIQKKEILEELGTVMEEIEELRVKFRTIALSTDVSVFEGEPTSTFDLKKELEQLAQPILAELKAATAEARELEQLNAEKDFHLRRQTAARKAVDNLDRLLGNQPPADLAERLREMRTLWEGRQRDAANQLTAIGHQLEQRRAERESVLDRTRGFASNFFRTRGMNLTLGVLAFLAVFLGMRGIALLIQKFRPKQQDDLRTFGNRLATLLWTVFTAIASLGAVLMVFNLTADWFLLSLTIIFLIGLAWAGFKTLPQFMEQFRMMLNLGAVREKERIVLDHIPWKVESIGFAVHLVNPDLDGGELTVPTRMLVGLYSRVNGQHEPWFPTRTKDWVLLPDGTFGQVAHQSPSLIRLDLPGGGRAVYPTQQFLALHPTVLSQGFRVESRFGIDYRHLDLAVDAIPARMREHLHAVLSGRLGDDLIELQVELAAAAASSLDYVIMADCAGKAAEGWPFLSRWIQAALVDLCHREGWAIPFPQLRIHQDEA